MRGGAGEKGAISPATALTVSLVKTSEGGIADGLRRNKGWPPNQLYRWEGEESFEKGNERTKDAGLICPVHWSRTEKKRHESIKKKVACAIVGTLAGRGEPGGRRGGGRGRPLFWGGAAFFRSQGEKF